ncbi:unnamed protein product [Amoebophrya sp. A120]|nr:unnamed protein product [Amoebophrya sp. A120]|eukprot:GSA120T00004839001.1
MSNLQKMGDHQAEAAAVSPEQIEMYKEVLQLGSDNSPNPQFQKAVAETYLELAEDRAFLDYVINQGCRKLCRPLLRMVERDAADVWASVLDKVESNNNGHGFASETKKQKERSSVYQLTRESCNAALQAMINLAATRAMAVCFLELNAQVRIADFITRQAKTLQTEAAADKNNTTEDEAEKKESQRLLQESIQLSVMLLGNLTGLVCQAAQDAEQDSSKDANVQKLLNSVVPTLLNFYLQPPICEKDLFVPVATTLISVCELKEGRALLAQPMILAILGQQLLARQRRKDVLKLYCKLAAGADEEVHQMLSSAQFLPRVCCYFFEKADVAAAKKQSEMLTAACSDKTMTAEQILEEEFHPLVLQEAQGISQDSDMKQFGIDLFYQFTKTENGRAALREQRVLPVLRMWRKSERDAEVRGKLQVVISTASVLQKDGDAVLETPLLITCDKDGNIQSLRAEEGSTPTNCSSGSSPAGSCGGDAVSSPAAERDAWEQVESSPATLLEEEEAEETVEEIVPLF